jgi:hypothetical protein
VQFNPHFRDYQLSCTFNECDTIEREREPEYKFRTNRYLYGIDDLGNHGWNDDGNFYTSVELADLLMKELISVNKTYQ